MRRFGLLLFCCLLALTAPVSAQILSPTPRCVTLVNQSGYTALGSVSTARFVAPDGTSSYHRENFRLNDTAQNQFCATGPFYADYGLEIQLRSLIPLWTCIAPANGQVIRILSRQDKGDDAVQLYMDCDPR
jgi:hypothetical protein